MVGEGGGDLGMRVRITPVIDQAQLKGEGKKVEKLLGSSKLGVKTLGGIQSGGISGKSAAIAGAVGGLVASAMQGLMGVMKKIFSTLVDSSGALKGVMKMLNMGFMQILRPIGDMLAMLLRPVAMFFRTIGRLVMKKFRERRAELLASGMSKQEAAVQLMGEAPGMYFEVIGEELAKLDWSKILGMIGQLLLDGFLNFNPIGMMLKFLMDHGQEILDAITGFGEWLWNSITGGIGNIATAIGNFGNWLWTEITKGIGSLGTALGGFGDWVYKALTGAITLPQALMDIGRTFYDMFVQVYNGFADFANLFSIFTGITVQKMLSTSEKAAWSNSSHQAEKDRFYANNPQFKSMASGGMMTGDGLIYAHAGEAVIGTDSLKSMITDAINVNSSNTIVIPGGAISDAIDRRVDHYYRTKVANRR